MLDSTLYALSDSTRRSILDRLAQKECTVNEIAEPYDMSLAAVSRHLKVLENANLIIKGKKDGATEIKLVHEFLPNKKALEDHKKNLTVILERLDHVVTG